MKSIALLAGSALLLAACATTPEAPTPPSTVSAITVNTDLQSIGNAESVSYWQGLDDDLEAALASAYLGRIDPAGAVISVDVDELSLANAFSSQFQGENSRLSGQVVVTDPVSGESIGVYDVTATAREAETLLTGAGVTTISPTSAEFYEAVVEAFARGVVQAVSGGGQGV